MNKTGLHKNYWLYALSSLHVGTGRGVGYIDLPIAREKVTNWPYVPGSAIKGVLADYHNASTEEKRQADIELKAAFGIINQHQDTQASASSGSLVFSDASIVCLPVRSFYGTFAWITSPLALARLGQSTEVKAPISSEINGILLPTGSKIAVDDKVYLEDIDLAAKEAASSDALSDMLAKNVFPDDEGWRAIFKERFAVVDNDTFTFLCETGTEVNARIRIKENSKTVADGALWYEESLPINTILAGVVWCDKVYGKDSNKAITTDSLMEKFCKDTCRLQIGGKATTGKGQVRCVFSGGKD